MYHKMGNLIRPVCRQLCRGYSTKIPVEWRPRDMWSDVFRGPFYSLGGPMRGHMREMDEMMRSMERYMDRMMPRAFDGYRRRMPLTEAAEEALQQEVSKVGSICLVAVR